MPDDQILPTLENLLHAEQGGHPRYVTVCDLTLVDGEAWVRVAGHPAPVLVRPARSATSTWPSVRRSASGSPATRRATGGRAPRPPPSGSVLLYTDGLLDAYARITAPTPSVSPSSSRP